ncbi:hypothetical protein QBC37DRAFT_379252 [Rhypophila decipiens]|uniref:Uncharacterized protein n=1 Tax=Rhypophila decipiens TaxID=261697 RepID=A0AAN7B362_9PEZI|nr:hypothetical protein QBC37DRAFT_379252 [Rhypophila decipiens]
MPSLTKFLALAAVAASLTSGFTIPEGQPDGIYFGNLQTGESQLLASINATSVRARRGTGAAALNARTVPLPVSDQGCPPAGLNAGDYLAAYSNFAYFCDNGGKIPGGRVTYAAVGSAVWYACSYGGEQPCDSPEISDAESRFNAKCGAARAAWVYMGDWKKTYGRDVASAEICGNL